MKKRYKFENVDLFSCLEQIVSHNTMFYQEDLEIDKKMIEKAAEKEGREDRTFLWLSRTCGTYCFPERDVYLDGSMEHAAWIFYLDEPGDRILAYAMEIRGKEKGKIMGDLYELDYAESCEKVVKESVPTERGTANGEGWKYNQEYDVPVPKDPDALEDVLRRRREERKEFVVGDFEKHVEKIRR